MPNIKMKNSVDFSFLPISNAFIEQYITRAKPIFICIYIYSLKKCLEGQTLTLKQIADDFDILESDVLSAWKFWKKEEIVDFKQNGDDFFIEFLPSFSAKTKFKSNFEINLDKPQKKELLIVPPVNQEKKNYIVNLKKDNIPLYTVEEINVYSEDDKVKNLFKAAEKAFAGYLDFSRMRLVFGFYDWLNMPVDLIQYLIEYCVSAEKGRNLKYIEKVALDWHEKGIDSVEKAKEYTERFNISYREILRAFGIANAIPIDKQIKYMDDWLSKFPLDLIKEAAQKTIMTIGIPRFEYADSIIKDWETVGVKTLSDVQERDSEFKKTFESKNKISNNFTNYEQREWDFDTLDKLKTDIS